MIAVLDDPAAHQWEHQPRHCMSPKGRLLTWYASCSDLGVHRQMYRLRNERITDIDGEAMRIEWGGTAS